MTTFRTLHELPQSEGYAFRGVLKTNGKTVPCRLCHTSGVGWYIYIRGTYRYDLNGADKLAGWLPYAKRT